MKNAAILLTGLLFSCKSTPDTQWLPPTILLSQLTIESSPLDSVHFISLKNSGTEELDWTVETRTNWLTLNPDSGSVSDKTDTLWITCRPSRLPSGNHQAKIHFHQIQYEQEFVITINLTISPPILIASDSLLSFGASNDSLELTLSNGGDGYINWTVNEEYDWLDFSPRSGTIRNAPQHIDLWVDRISLPPGDFAEYAEIGSNAGKIMLQISLTEGIPVWRFDFDSDSLLRARWDINDLDTIQPYGLDKWGYKYDTQKKSGIVWCNGTGVPSSGQSGYDGGINSTMSLLNQFRPDIHLYGNISVQFEFSCEFGNDGDLFRAYIGGDNEGRLTTWTSNSSGWKTHRYSFTNEGQFLQPLNIQFNFLSVLPAENEWGVKVDNLEVWAK